MLLHKAKLISVLLFVFAFSYTLIACGPKPQDATNVGPKRAFKDELGRTLAVKHPPQRIVSLAPSVTETLFALGLENQIIAVTSYCDYPAAAGQKEKIGDTLHLNLERIIALRPDLVVISTASQLEVLTRRLDELAIPVYVSNPRTVREVVASLLSLGEVTGTTERARTVASEMERRIDDVQRRLQGLARPKLLYVLQTSPLITTGGKTFINDLIVLSGASSISSTETADYPQFSRETVAARAPDVIIAPVSHGTELVTEHSIVRDFPTTPAVINRRILRIDPNLVDRPGPRIVDGLEQLARGLHPEAFK